MKLKVIVHEAVEGCLSVETDTLITTDKDRVLEIVV